MKTLENGLRVVHLHQPGPMAAIYLWFDVGTSDENPGEYGAAHLLEHMLFKGTPNHGVGQVAAAIEALGGDLNAYTVWDQTVLHATVLGAHWQEALDVLADMAWNSDLDPEELEREKLVVVEEIRGYADDPQSVADDRLTADLFPGHAYGRPVLGTEESVLTMSHAALHGFWRRHYGASRCILGIVGPMHEDEVIAAAEALQPPAAMPRSELAPLPACERGVDNIEGDFDTPIVLLGYRVPGGDHPDVPGIEILTQALGGGRASMLQRSVRFEQRLVNDLWATSYARRDGGSLEIGFIPNAGKGQEALEAVLKVVEAARCGMDSTDVARARVNLLADHAYASESVDAVAHDLVWFTAREGGPDGREAWNRKLALVDTDAVTRLASTHLHTPLIRVLDPEARLTIPAPPPQREPVKGVWISGQHDDWTTQGEIVSVYLGMPGGRLAEPANRAGLADAWASLVTCGAGDLDSVAFARELDLIAGSIRAVGGRNTCGIQLRVPAVDARRGLELLQLVVERPRFDLAEWERTREEYIFDLDTLGDRPDEVLGRRLAKLSFPDHPWGRVLTRSTLRAINPSALRTFHEDTLARGIRVGVAGRCSPELLEPLGLTTHPLNHADLPLHPLREGRFESTAGQGQALHVCAHRSPPIGHPDQPALAVALGVLGSQAGRLFMELRERRSLAYSVWAHKREGISSGLLVYGLATDPDRLAEARRSLRQTFAVLAEEGPTEAEVERTVRMLLGQFASGHQNAATRATHLAMAQLYGYAPGFARYRERLESITPDQVQDVLKRLPAGLELTVRP